MKTRFWRLVVMLVVVCLVVTCTPGTVRADARTPVLQTLTGLKAVPAGKNQVSLSWEPVSDAEGYLVYGQKNGKYGYVGMTTKGSLDF